MYRSGVVIGKFYPPHAGHQFLIDTALAQCERVTVIVCDKEGQSIPGEMRATWLREMCPAACVQVIEDVYPEDDSAVWARKTIEWLGSAPDAVFTSERYGDSYSGLMGSVHVSVDPSRATVSCSGTAIRVDPLANWPFLPPSARAYYAVRLCVVGAESSGTTTLAQSLAEHYATGWVPEYGREYSERFKFREGATWSSEEFVTIAARQCELEDEAARRCNRLLICDTDPLATAIWHERYMGRRSPAVETIARDRQYALYLVTAPDIPFVQDGYRDGEHFRGWMHERFVEELSTQNRVFAVIEGSREDRVTAAVRRVDAVLASCTRDRWWEGAPNELQRPHPSGASLIAERPVTSNARNSRATARGNE